MHNPACLRAEYRSFFVSESSSLQEYVPGRERREWSDDEIAAIRLVLQRLTTIRVLNANDAEDLVQETLLTMITKYPKGAWAKGPLAWSLGILRRKVGNYYRKAQRHAPFNERDAFTREWVQRSVPPSSPEMKVFHEELREIVDETLAQLPPSQRQAMELLIAGFGTREIVKHFYPERYQNVINRLYRGRQKLAKELAKYGYGPNARAGMRKLLRCRARK